MLLKFDNNLLGIKLTPLIVIPPLGSSGCYYIWFANLNLVFVYSYTWPVVPSGSAFSCFLKNQVTSSYVLKYGFRFVYVNSMTTPETLYKGLSMTNTLT